MGNVLKESTKEGYQRRLQLPSEWTHVPEIWHLTEFFIYQLLSWITSLRTIQERFLGLPVCPRLFKTNLLFQAGHWWATVNISSLLTSELKVSHPWSPLIQNPSLWQVVVEMIYSDTYIFSWNLHIFWLLFQLN